MDIFRTLLIALTALAVLVSALTGDETNPATAVINFNLNNANRTHSCVPGRTGSCFEQGGQRAIYDLAMGQAKYFMFGLASTTDERDTQLKALGLSPAFAGCIIDSEGYEEGYNSVIEIFISPKIKLRETSRKTERKPIPLGL